MKRLLSLLLASVLTLSLAACSGGSSDGGAATADNPVTLTFKSLAWIKDEQVTQRRLIDQWNEENPHIQVELVSADWGTASQELLTAFETGDVPDIFQYAQPIIADWKNLGFLDDMSVMLTDEDLADVNDDVWSGLTADDGSIVGIPIQYEVDVTFYNKEIFEKNGIEPPTMDNPWTFDQMVEVARQLHGSEDGLQGMGFPGPDHFGRVFTEVWAPKIGDQLVYDDGNGGLEVRFNDESIDLIEKIHDLIAEGIISQDMLSTDSNSIALEQFLNGKSAMIVGYGCWYRSQFINESEGMEEIDWGVAAPIKVNTTSVYGYIQTLSVPAAGKNKDAAYEFLKWYWSSENTLEVAKSAYIMPGRNSAVRSEELSTSEYAWDLCQEAAGYNVLPDYVRLPGWGQFTESIANTLFGEYFTGTITLEDCISRLESEGTRILREAVED